MYVNIQLRSSNVIIIQFYLDRIDSRRYTSVERTSTVLTYLSGIPNG